ncbi:hypothetical protein D3C80_1918350 [compost metagenome]
MVFQVTTHKVHQWLALWPGDFHSTVGRRLIDQIGERLCNIGRSHRLQRGGGQTHVVTVGAGIGNGPHEFEELRGS